jgi:TOMM system kinase/cyclase fusion protein
MSSLPAPGPLAPGTRFQDRYEILAEVGAGSFGRVYRARQLSTGQDVAIKLLRVFEGDSAADVATQRERFRREMRLCAALSHPHIVRLLDSGSLDADTLYAVFEFVPGPTLRQVLVDEERLDRAEALHLMTQVLDALCCAHAQGIVHRDLKPENIIITRTGLRRNATVLDFGLSGFTAGAIARDALRLTASRELLGTPSYAAPEQLRGEVPSPGSDIYSWGLVLLECLTGEVAISGRTPHEVVMMQMGPDPVPIPPWLREQRLGRLLAAVTAKEAAARDVPVDSLLAALESIQHEATTSSSSEAHAPTVEGERRQVTVVSCTTSVARVDDAPVELDDLDQAMQSQERLYEDVGRQAGQAVVRTDPGEVQIVFGHPKTRENDARRAVRLALRIAARSHAAAELLRLERGLVVAVHLALHSGLGIVRASAGDTASPGRLDVIGPPAAMSARLAKRAAPGEIVVTGETHALLRDEFASEPLGDDAVFPELGTGGRAFRILGERPTTALDTFLPAEETPLVGRAGEMAQLVDLWSHAEAGELGCALLQGEAGIGKSRLVRELRRRAPADACIACRCTPEGRTSPLHPVLAWLRSLPALPALLAELDLAPQTAWPLLAQLLDVPCGDGYEPPRLTPERQKELTLQTLARLVVRLARRRATLFVLEDLHWADPTTGEFLVALLDAAHAAHVTAAAERPGLFLLFTARPEFVPPWAAQDVTVLQIGRLSRRDVVQLVNAGRAPEQAFTSWMLDRIVERTDGVPLFVEELAHALPVGDDAAAIAAIPSSLLELLTARLDAVSASAHETVQFAAACGREVSWTVLAAVVPKDLWVLRQDLTELVESRLLFARRSTDEETYVFKHALVRDAAYDSMLRATRERVHRTIAETMRVRLPDVGEREPETLAHHLEQGGELALASTYWYRAGDRAFRRNGHAEAIAHLEHAVAVLAKVPATPSRVQQEIDALTLLGTVYHYTTGHSHPRGHEAFANARRLSEAHGVELSLKIVAQLSAAYIIAGKRDAVAALEPHCERLMASSEAVARLTGLSPLALAAFWRGDHERARALFDAGLPLYQTDVFREYAESYGWDGGIYLPLYAAWNSAIMGDPPERGDVALAAASTSFDPQAPALVHVFAMVAAHVRGDTASARRHAEEAIAISTEQHFWGLLAFALCGQGLARVHGGEHAEGMAQIRQTIDGLRAVGARTPLGYYLTYLAEAHLAVGEVDEGLAAVAEGLRRCETELARTHEAELLRLEGELLRLRGDVPGAEDRFRRAAALAEARRAHAWAARAAASLARLRPDAKAVDLRQG